jgi:hypothetical protein
MFLVSESTVAWGELGGQMVYASTTFSTPLLVTWKQYIARKTREEEAKLSGCYDVLEAIMRWVMAEHGRLDHVLPWRKGEKQRFLRVHGSWPKHKRSFVDNQYEFITKEVRKWIDDTGMLVFCFLIRKFWENVIETKSREVEIWTANFFNMNLNIVKETC